MSRSNTSEFRALGTKDRAELGGPLWARYSGASGYHHHPSNRWTLDRIQDGFSYVLLLLLVSFAAVEHGSFQCSTVLFAMLLFVAMIL